MAEYEVIREIQNPCAGNQMRDVSFDEVEIDDPFEYVRALLRFEKAELSVEKQDEDTLTMFADCGGIHQRFLFTRI